MSGTAERQRLRSTFDAVAQEYQRARPDYPDELLDALIGATGIEPGDRLLEIGCASGKVTVPLARRGFRITGVELGGRMVAEARRNLAAFPEVEIVHGAFEQWSPATPRRYRLVFAAAAWHWIDPAVGYRLAWDAVQPGGHLAFWSCAHVFPRGGDPFFAHVQNVYDEIGEGLPDGSSWPRPGELPDSRAAIERSGLFVDVTVRHFDWEVSYDVEGYLALLNTFSGHIAMEPAKREYLYSRISELLASRPNGRLRRHWGAVLHVARRRG
ncbi:MAG TPA: class I SAM-dependent methyltransferase [Pseudonocardia sp.]|jgi:SAM-dependent methyltransferase|nr:class I SAM-dependent methyltransferase [Pseudonocardia sp.]